MSESQIPAAATWPRLLKLAVGTTILCFLAAGLFMLPTARPTNTYRANTLRHAVALESAIHSFYTEYGVLPDIGSHIQTDGPDGVRFLNILLGLEGESAQKQNLRDIKFLSVKEAKGRKNGLQYNEKGNRVEGLYDAWGNPFIVEINVKNEEKLRFNYGSKIVELPRRLVAAYSPGKDGKSGTPDDVITWNQ